MVGTRVRSTEMNLALDAVAVAKAYQDLPKMTMDHGHTQSLCPHVTLTLHRCSAAREGKDERERRKGGRRPWLCHPNLTGPARGSQWGQSREGPVGLGVEEGVYHHLPFRSSMDLPNIPCGSPARLIPLKVCKIIGPANRSWGQHQRHTGATGHLDQRSEGDGGGAGEQRRVAATLGCGFSARRRTLLVEDRGGGPCLERLKFLNICLGISVKNWEKQGGKKIQAFFRYGVAPGGPSSKHDQQSGPISSELRTLSTSIQIPSISQKGSCLAKGLFLKFLVPQFCTWPLKLESRDHQGRAQLAKKVGSWALLPEWSDDGAWITPNAFAP